jgi:hypothetical protein
MLPAQGVKIHMTVRLGHANERPANLRPLHREHGLRRQDQPSPTDDLPVRFLRPSKVGHGSYPILPTAAE